MKSWSLEDYIIFIIATGASVGAVVVLCYGAFQ